jgi:aspartokinase
VLAKLKPHLLTIKFVGDNRMDRTKIGGVIQYTDLALVGMMAVPDRPGIAAAVFETLGKRGINVLFIVQSIDLNSNTHIVFCVASKDLSLALGLLEPLKQRFGGQGVIHNPRVAIVSIFGPDFKERPGIAGMMYTTLANADINILAISTSMSSVSCVIDKDRLADAMEALKGAFEFHDRWSIAVQ